MFFLSTLVSANSPFPEKKRKQPKRLIYMFNPSYFIVSRTFIMETVIRFILTIYLNVIYVP